MSEIKTITSANFAPEVEQSQGLFLLDFYSPT